MSTLIAAEGLGHGYHDEWLFKNLTLGINSGQRVALVGINGAGKSTLLKLLAERFPPLEGKIVKNKAVKIGFLDQEPQFTEGFSISDHIFSLENKQQQLIKEYEELIEDPNPDEKTLNRLYEELSEHNAWEYEHEIKTILNRMGITHLQQKISTLSGGQKKRLALAKLLIEDPEILVLDEPTNHLDIDTIEWLEKLLTTGQKTILLVTHDRYFLDNVCNTIVELDRGKIFNYNGNYAYYLEKKSEREALDATVLHKNQQLLKKELEWMRRMPQARGTKSNARINAFYDLEEKSKKKSDNQSINLQMKMSRQGGKIIEIEHIKKAFDGRPIINDFSYTFKKGDRIGLAGKNGTGKSTLLNIITSQLKPDAGKVDTGDTTVFGYYKQGGLTFDPKERVIDIVKSDAEYIKMADGSVITASALLTLFLFPPKKQHGMVEKLSGGEKKRLNLMKVLMQNPNFLILDEPTNDLDIDTLNVLEEFLENFPGILMLVSHDRYLLDKMSDQLFIMEGEGVVKIYNGNYSEYRLSLEQPKVKAETKKTPAPVVEQTPIKAVKKLSFKEQKELEESEKGIAETEKKIASLNESLVKIDAADYVKIQEVSSEIELLQAKLDELTMRWLELSE
ncbi:Energy-dependent translational throttle protein EttA [Pedobacter sp. Bi27]|uniref:ABC-F family ATP-binding cassette domain-containing protein n=1 Tax=unclassified Pedobacter TaxID=2628915 RepID=UPI001D3DD4ED|nr:MULTISPECIES: ABC-F family ATP-binding cassette domain-containing protein [unclassified Pedobacter]CAH0184574.1 Energy-dependent translational throttle protein EttA [Pedobacter sp. Bi36]CAH0208870.1 Energy-dependent translational throttle protein EttA [Pedobacter sp. Bi27]CAH0240430.1 Energy-dependent translational throttle protein EttA [Pedobacter sp. Bi126]